MKKLHKYILVETFVPATLGLVFFTVLLLINKLFRMIEFLINKNVGLNLLGELMVSLIPVILGFTIPMGFLVGVLVAYGRLASDNEILAIKTSGISLVTIYIPIIIISIVLSGLLIAMNYNFIPNLLYKTTDILYQIEFKVLSSIQPRKFYDDLTGGEADLTLYCADKDPVTNELKGLNIKIASSLSDVQKATASKKKKKIEDAYLEEALKIKKKEMRKSKEVAEKKEGEKKKDGKNKDILILAARGKVESDLQNKSIQLRLSNGSIHLLSQSDKSENDIVFFDEFIKILKPKIGTIKDGRFVKPPEQMSIPELRKEYKILPPDIKIARKIKREIHERFSFPLACIAFALIGMPLGVFIRPSGKSYGFAISFALLFIYYVFAKWGATLLEQNIPIGMLAIYSPNILIGMIGIFLIWYSLKK